MSTAWTEEQKQVIDLRDKNILVSAAAGSGKTAVLVERILSRVTDPVHPIDLDRLLVVTFTKAAAGEMRERIGAAIEKKLGEEPDNVHLQRQSSLLHHAQITTIDSFCSYVVRNYFHKIDLDPGFRIGDDGELKLLMQDTARQVLEEAYEEGKEEFLILMEAYAAGKSDVSMEELIQQLYQFSVSTTLPERWLRECKKSYQAETEEELENSIWMQQLRTDSDQILREAMQLNEKALKIIRQEDGPRVYEEALANDSSWIRKLLEAESFQKRYEAFAGHKYTALSRKKDPDASEEKKELVKYLREQCKSLLNGLREQYYFQSREDVLADMKEAAVPVCALLDLTGTFASRFSQEKRERNMLDFGDLEHFALEILVEQEETSKGILCHYTEAARELASGFEEIMIDEYQDSNYVQELLLTAVSRIPDGGHNMFMVGDVKQSIYRFRLARPEIFMEKYHSYQNGREGCQRVDLHKNFRSRKEVLDGVNFIFRQIMRPELGNVEYDEDAMLRNGAAFPASDEEPEHNTEIVLVEIDDAQWQQMETEENAVELEARAIAMRIKKMVGKEQILDKHTGQYRPIQYRDCVILLRTVAGWAETIGKMLDSQGIPVHITSRTGYFSALEVVTALNYLHICDNPLQDIPFTGILYSPIGGCTARELAVIKAAYPDGYISQAARNYMEREDAEEQLQDKLRRFFHTYDTMRRRSLYVPIHQLLYEILQETGYQAYVRALPGGEQRYANLQMLLERAREFGKTSYRGLFHFIRYIENLQKYQYELGEASMTSASEDAVQIMSIHKSKGLEFPVVFAAGMGKHFNLQDSRSQLLLHMEYGVGADAVDYKMRVKSPTLLKKMIQRQLVRDSLGEELRVLYVALTRAKEKLILTGTIEKLEKHMLEYHVIKEQQEEPLSFSLLSSASCYFDWILPALARHRAMDPLYERYESKKPAGHPMYQDVSEFSILCISPLELTMEEINRQGEKMQKKEAFLWMQQQERSDDAMWEERFSYVYPYENRREIPMKISVSDLKAGKFKEEEEVALYEETLIPYIPRFMQQEEKHLQGAARGTAYHRVMECLDYEKVSSVKEIERQMARMQREGKITAEMADCIEAGDIAVFVQSSIGQRMKRAGGQKRLYREKQFFLEIPASRLRDQWPEEESVLVQGIIDAFFVEDDGLVLVDYKTDQVFCEQQLAERYRVQLEAYEEALEKLMGMSVKEKIIYSFTLGKEILL
ncbi:MAG: helicase-exonuclease AddAB subunit AddA [Lachnospiraceae bacterium]